MFDANIHKMVNLTQTNDRDLLGEKSLWQSVLMQAALDATSTPKTDKEKAERAKTVSWFSMRNKDFLLVCSFAELDPQFVIKGVRKAIIKNHYKQKIQRTKNIRRNIKKTNIKPIKQDISKIYL